MRDPKWVTPGTVFLSAFLLFQVQPLCGKLLLPRFGGSAAAWATCLCFFQVVLFLSYGYVHLLEQRHGRGRRIALHASAVIVAALLLPKISTLRASFDQPGQYRYELLLSLATSVGLPYFVLCSTSPLLQAWSGIRSSGRDPYRLYAVSNLGSLSGLVTYPFLIEPFVTNRAHIACWSAAFLVFAAGMLACAYLPGVAAGATESAPAQDPGPAVRPSAPDRVLWILMAACGSVLLISVTSRLCQDIAAVPLLWILPLTCYLLTLIVCFHDPGRYRRAATVIALGLLVAGMSVLRGWVLNAGPAAIILLYLAALLLACFVCHGELAKIRPGLDHLTSFYLHVAAGGALGGVAGSLVAPMLFTESLELPMSFQICFLLVVAAALREREWRFLPRLRGPVVVTSLLFVLGIAGWYLSWTSGMASGVIVARRNLFGIVRVIRSQDARGEPVVALFHGDTLHGFQYVDAEKHHRATTYYGPRSGVGLLMLNYPRPETIRVGLVGLGTGTIATYGQSGDVFRFYELNDAIVDLAEHEFSYLRDSAATIEIAVGDARLLLQQERPQGFNILILDAFSSDAIPAHLLTVEAFDVYLRHLASKGVIAVHLSNKYLNLAPLVMALAQTRGLDAVMVEDGGDADQGTVGSSYALLGRPPGAFRSGKLGGLPFQEILRPKGVRPWTDDYSSMLGLLR